MYKMQVHIYYFNRRVGLWALSIKDGWCFENK